MCAVLAIASPALATDGLRLLAGGVRIPDGESISRNYQAAYEIGWRTHPALAIGFTYLNEGHFPGHHRDGFGLQLWSRWRPAGQRWTLAAGAGPYAWFDTTASRGVAGESADDHGFGALVSARMTVDLSDDFFLEGRVNRSLPRGAFGTTSWLLGLGYRLGRDATAAEPSRSNANELGVLIGTTVVNSFAGEKSVAGQVHLRHRLDDLFDISVVYLNEGDPGVVSRHGVAAQLWVMQRFAPQRFELGVGYGPYIGFDRAGGKDTSHLTRRLSVTAAWQIDSRWVARLSFSRVVTRYDRDTDVFLAGLGYRF